MHANNECAYLFRHRAGRKIDFSTVVSSPTRTRDRPTAEHGRNRTKNIFEYFIRIIYISGIYLTYHLYTHPLPVFAGFAPRPNWICNPRGLHIHRVATALPTDDPTNPSSPPPPPLSEREKGSVFPVFSSRAHVIYVFYVPFRRVCVYT